MATLRERWLGDLLADLRSRTGFTVQDVADRLEVSTSTVQRIERAVSPPKRAVLDGLLALYGPTDEESARVWRLWRTVKTRGWWSAYADDIIDPGYADLETSASRIRSFQNAYVTGLLQTEEYARCSFAASRPGEEAGNLQRLDARMRRRTHFNHRPDPPELHAILDEAVLRRPVGGPEAMREQIEYLIKAAARPNVTVQIVPFEAGAYGGMAGPFVLLSFDSPDYPDVVYVESRGGELYPESDRALEEFHHEWDRFTTVALSPQDSMSLLNQLVGE